VVEGTWVNVALYLSLGGVSFLFLKNGHHRTTI
jgi:hypothetical protein